MPPRYRTADQNWVRERNLSIVLRYIWEAGGPIARARLTEISGLNKSTIGTSAGAIAGVGLCARNRHAECGAGPPRRADRHQSGRRPHRSARRSALISSRSCWLICARTSCGGARLIPTARSSNQDSAQVMAQAEAVVREAIQQAQAGGHRVLGIGLGVPGLIDHATGALLFAPNLGWRDVPLRDMWRALWRARDRRERGQRSGAGRDACWAWRRQVDNFIYLSAGVGLGGGFVIDGKLYGGAGGFAGEIGHMTLVPDGPQCNCGNRGCWETLIGPTAIIDRVRQAAQAGPYAVVDGTAGSRWRCARDSA